MQTVIALCYLGTWGLVLFPAYTSWTLAGEAGQLFAIALIAGALAMDGRGRRMEAISVAVMVAVLVYLTWKLGMF